MYEDSNKDFWRSARKLERWGIKRYEKKKCGMYMFLISEMLKALFTNKKVLWIMYDKWVDQSAVAESTSSH